MQPSWSAPHSPEASASSEEEDNVISSPFSATTPMYPYPPPPSSYHTPHKRKISRQHPYHGMVGGQGGGYPTIKHEFDPFLPNLLLHNHPSVSSTTAQMTTTGEIYADITRIPSPNHPGNEIPNEYRNEVERVFFEFLNRICSNCTFLSPSLSLAGIDVCVWWGCSGRNEREWGAYTPDFDGEEDAAA
jgi:hypothetical protein